MNFCLTNQKEASLKSHKGVCESMKGYIDVDDRCWRRMLVTDLIHLENHQHNEKSRRHNDSVTNTSNQSPS